MHSQGSSEGRAGRPLMRGSVLQSAAPAACRGVLGQDPESQIAPDGCSMYVCMEISQGTV